MTLPVRSLPVVQNWDCHSCGDCCREYRVHVTPEEQAAIEAQGWADLPEYRGKKLFVRDGGWFSKKIRLNQREDGACIFLGADGYCQIHAKFGTAAKPLACRIYPFVLVPANDHWRVGLRYACPSVADNLGRSTEAHQAAVNEFAYLLAEREHLTRGNIPNPPCPPGQTVPWPDLLRFVKAFREIITESGGPLELRLRRCLELAALCRQARFDRVAGDRLREFLELVKASIIDEVPPASEVEEPAWVGRTLFRRTLAIYVRKDTGVHKGVSRYGRLSLMKAAYRFASGRGRVPKLHGLIPTITFDAIEQARRPLTPSIDAMLTRYYAVKLESLQFCGKTNFDLHIWDGLDALIFTFPAICWLATALNDQPREAAFVRALRTVDDNFGYNPLLGGRMQKWAMRMLSSQKELGKLVAWYGVGTESDA